MVESIGAIFRQNFGAGGDSKGDAPNSNECTSAQNSWCKSEHSKTVGNYSTCKDERNKKGNSSIHLLLLTRTYYVFWKVTTQSRWQDFVAGRGQKPQRGPRFSNTILDVCSNRGSNMKWGAQISNGRPGTTGPPAGDGPV